MGLNVGLYLKEAHVYSDKQNSLTHSILVVTYGV